MATELEFCLLGPLVVRRGGATVAVSPGKQRVILAMLLLNAGHVVSTDELAETLWSSGPPPSGLVAVQNYVMRLRNALGDVGRDRILTQPPGYLISVHADELDVSRFETLLADARAAARDGRWQEAQARARAAVELWRGQPLADIDSDALASREVPRLEELRLQALETRIDAELRLGRHADVVAELRQLASAHPLRERLHAQLMLALYRDRRQAEALAAYQVARQLLIDELGAEPGRELRALHQQILAGDPAITAPEPALSISGTARPDNSAPSWRPLRRPANIRRTSAIALIAVACAVIAAVGIVWSSQAKNVVAVPPPRTAFQRIVTPLYASPTAAYWLALARAAPTTRAAIVDICAPDGSGSGCNGKPADAASPGWPPTVKALSRAGVTPLYYISTRYAAAPIATVETEVRDAISWYDTADMFFDQVPTSCSNVSYYQRLYRYVHHLGGIVMLDAGAATSTSSCYMPAADILQVFTGSQAQFQTETFPSWLARFPSSRFAAVISAGTRSSVGTDIRDAARDRIGNVYVDDETGTPDFSTLPAFWSAEVSDMKAKS